MAVQKNRKTRSKRGMGRSHNAIVTRAVSFDSSTGFMHVRHHISPDGYYRGKEAVKRHLYDGEGDDGDDSEQ